MDMLSLKLFVFVFVVILRVSANITDEEYASIPPLYHTDNFDRCMLLGEKMLYCNVELQLAPANSNFSKSWLIIRELSNRKKNYRHDLLRRSICVPLSCPINDKNISFYRENEEVLKEEISKCYSDKYKDLDLKIYVKRLHCETNRPFYDVDIYDTIVGVSLIILFGVVVFASFYEGVARYKTNEEYDNITGTKFGTIISCFSIPKNWKRLGSKNINQNLAPLGCINGIRFYNMLLVVMSHTVVVVFVNGMVNTKYGETISDDPLNMILLNGGFTVQTFFLSAGWILSYNFFLTFEGSKPIKPIYMFLAFFNRYIRLTPCLLVIISLNSTWLYRYSRGPYWDNLMGSEYRNCRKNWWTNLLYINNYYDTKNMCLLQSWYLASDTQLFLMSLVIIFIMCKHQNHIKLILGICLAIGILVPGLTNYAYSYDVVVRHYPENLRQILVNLKEFTDIFIPAHTNINGYVIGIIFGFLFYKTRGKKVFTKKWHVIVWWIVAWSLPFMTIFMAVIFYQDDFEYSRIGAAIYVALARTIFSFSVALGIFGFAHKIGWFARDCVFWFPAQVLGRMSYCVYLIHGMVIRIRAGENRFPSYVSGYTLLIQVIGDFTLSYIFGLLLCLFVELPMSALQKLMTPKSEKKEESNLKSEMQVTVNVEENLTSKI